MNTESKFKKKLKVLVCYFARPIASKNIFGLLIIPSVALGFIWGFAFIKVLSFTQEPGFKKMLDAVHLTGFEIPLAIIPFLIVTYFSMYPVCRSIQLLLPETFSDEDYEELDD